MEERRHAQVNIYGRHSEMESDCGCINFFFETSFDRSSWRPFSVVTFRVCWSHQMDWDMLEFPLGERGRA